PAGRRVFSSHSSFFGPWPVRITPYRKSQGPRDAYPEPPGADPPDARLPPQATRPHWPRAGGQPVASQQALRSALLRLPPRRPVAPSPSPHLERGRQVTHRLRAPGSPRGGPSMGARTSTPQSSAPRGQPVDPGPDPGPRPGPTTATGATLSIGPALVRTV